MGTRGAPIGLKPNGKPTRAERIGQLVAWAEDRMAVLGVFNHLAHEMPIVNPVAEYPAFMTRSDGHESFEPIRLDPDDRVFILTGAGISAESGIKTFRDAGGLWEGYRFEEVASPEGWAVDPAVVWRFYSQRRAQLLTCSPNAAHRALAAMESALGDRLFLCTQNVDDLHERGGSRRVVHMHGEILKSRCETCSRSPFHDDRSYEGLGAIPRCTCGARIRPHICWFGEVPFEMDLIAAELERCNVFVTVGSSGVVYPAADFVRQAKRRRNVRSIYVGPERPGNGALFDEHRLGTATQVVPTLFDTSAKTS